MALRPQHVAQELLNKVTKALGITVLDQWYYVSHHTAKQVIGPSTLNEFGGSLSSFLKYAYPQHHFDEEKLASTRKLEKNQKFIEVIIRQLFPNEDIQTKARKSVGIINPETGAHLEIDFWIPSLKLGIEYQDKHHYGYQWYAYEPLAEYQKRDEIKKDAMSKLGYTLITIGYWWDKTIASVATTIRKYRPDLLQEYESDPAEPVLSEPPYGYTVESPAIPGVAGLMSPIIPRGNFDPTNWLAGEKHDGIRGLYNPNLNKIFSRSGNELSVLPSLMKDIPNILVEGEITAGRGNYNNTAAVSYHTHLTKVNWPMFRYLIFDIPDTELGNYTQRYDIILRELSTLSSIFAQPALRVLVVNKSHLEMLVDAIISDGGEGVIAQQDTQYEYGRAKGLAKIKVRRDADAQVLHINNLSCACELTTGVTAEISFCGDFDPSNLKIGDIVSYYHDGYSQSGLPKRGEVYKIRYDVSWKDLICGEEMQTDTKRRSVKDALGSRAITSRNTARYKLGHWNKSTNIRAFLDEFARKAGFDPLLPENWYQVRNKPLLRARGYLLKHYTLKQALKAAYPELKFDDERFGDYSKPSGTSLTNNPPNKRVGHWKQLANVRAFFDEFARTSGFDPLLPKNWYPVTVKTIKQAGGSGVLSANSGILKKALEFAYPELKFKQAKFRIRVQPTVRSGHWNKSHNLKTFLNEFARMKGFDPLVPENWYSIRFSAVRKAGGGGLLNARSHSRKQPQSSTMHSNLLHNALASAYPEVKFEDTKFRTKDIL